MLASRQYRVMTLAERGLLFSMRLECWVNRCLPADPHLLARVLGYDAGEVVAALPNVMAFFRSDGREITSPELDAYREHLAAIRERQSQGGKQGAAKTNSRRIPSANSEPSGDSPGNPQVACGSGVELSRAESSRAKLSRTPVLTVKPLDDPWVDSYNAASQGQ